MSITVSAFRWVPEFAQGQVRDMRVRWALEELGLPYQVRLLGQGDGASAAYRRMQPFGQVPAYEEDGLVLFESGAILLHIAERSPLLLPNETGPRARAIAWMFAALNSIEPPMMNYATLDAFHPGESWIDGARPGMLKAIETRLDELDHWLGDRDWLEERFTVADLLMATVLEIPRDEPIIGQRPRLAAYRDRCTARPAYARALAAHMKPFAEGPPKAA